MAETALEIPVAAEKTALPAEPETQGGQPKNRIGRYHLVQKLGSGETGNVYRARQWGIDRNVIIKILPRRLQEDPEYLEHFYRAAKTAGKLQHINIVKAIDVGQANGHHYFVMEDVEGKTLKELLDGGEAFEERRAVEVILQVVRALSHAHSRGIFHGDIHPGNIYVTAGNVVKLAGLGLAKELVDHSAHRTRVLKWAAHYVSPEEVRGDPKDIRSDIFALGAALYHLLTGVAPFGGQSPVEILAARLKKKLKSPQSCNATLSPSARHVLERMLAREPADRYQTPQDLLNDLERVQEGSAPVSERIAPEKTCLRRGRVKKKSPTPAENLSEPSFVVRHEVKRSAAGLPGTALHSVPCLTTNDGGAEPAGISQPVVDKGLSCRKPRRPLARKHPGASRHFFAWGLALGVGVTAILFTLGRYLMP
jgi:serine/threonine-protein kinase